MNVVTERVTVLRTYVVLLASSDEMPVAETLPVPVPVGPSVMAVSVPLAKGPLEVPDGAVPVGPGANVLSVPLAKGPLDVSDGAEPRPVPVVT